MKEKISSIAMILAVFASADYAKTAGWITANLPTAIVPYFWPACLLLVLALTLWPKPRNQ
jgi:hypothetical protein